MSSQSHRECPEKQGDQDRSHASPIQITEPEPKGGFHSWKEKVSYISLLTTTFLFSLDNTIVANLQPPILQQLGHVELLPWIGVGFALGTMFILPWGKAYAVFNTKWIYVFNILLFEVGSAVCGAAPSMPALIVGRVLAGVGGAGMYSGTLTYISRLTDMKERPLYLSLNTVIWGVGSVLGPVVGGAFAESPAGWRWAFYISLPIGAVFAPAYILLVPSIDPTGGQTFANKCRMFDWITAVVFLAGSCSLVAAVSFGGVVYEWSSPTEIALWVMAGTCLVATIWLAKRHPGVDKKNRLYPAHFFGRPILVVLQVQMFLVSGIALTMTYYVPLFFQFLRGDGPLEAGVRLLPYVVSLVVVSMINGLLMPSALPHSLPWYALGSILTTIGSALMYSAGIETPNAAIYGYSTLVGAGAGAYVVAGFAVVQSLVSVEELGDAIGSMTISQDLGMVLFLAISGSIYTNVSLLKLLRLLPFLERADADSLVAGTNSAVYRALSDDIKFLVIREITNAMRYVWLFFLTAAALSIILSLPLWRTKLLV